MKNILVLSLSLFSVLPALAAANLPLTEDFTTGWSLDANGHIAKEGVVFGPDDESTILYDDDDGFPAQATNAVLKLNTMGDEARWTAESDDGAQVALSSHLQLIGGDACPGGFADEGAQAALYLHVADGSATGELRAWGTVEPDGTNGWVALTSASTGESPAIADGSWVSLVTRIDYTADSILYVVDGVEMNPVRLAATGVDSTRLSSIAFRGAGHIDRFDAMAVSSAGIHASFSAAPDGCYAATYAGSVENETGAPADVYLVWDTADRGTSLDAWPNSRLLGTATTALELSGSLDGLAANTAYALRLCASNAEDVVWLAARSVRTAAEPVTFGALSALASGSGSDEQASVTFFATLTDVGSSGVDSLELWTAVSGGELALAGACASEITASGKYSVFLDKALAYGTAYDYRFRAVCTVDGSEVAIWSPVATYTTPVDAAAAEAEELTVVGSVRINEVIADNDGLVTYPDGTCPDLIELWNYGSQTVDLSGWGLSDNDKDSKKFKWVFPAGTTIGAGEYLLLYADKAVEPLDSDGLLHVSFGISKDAGEYLGLCAPSGTVVSKYVNTPEQIENVSYGYGTYTEELLTADGPCEYRVGGTGDFAPAVGGIGFAPQGGQFEVTQYKINTSFSDLDTAIAYTADPSKVQWTASGSYESIAFADSDSGAASAMGAPNAFPGNSGLNSGTDYYTLKARTTILVPTPGQWSFCVRSDDGFRLDVNGHGQNFESEFTGGRSFSASVATFNFPVAGAYDLNLFYFEINGGSSLDLTVAQGAYQNYDADAFKPVGTQASGILHAGAINAAASTDLSEEMVGVSPLLEVRRTFTLDEAPSADDAYTLSVRYADGFVALLNGTEVARVNVPAGTVTASTAASGAREEAAVLQWSDYAVPASALVEGENTLTLLACNDSASDGSFLIQSRLSRLDSEESLGYLTEPTPGAANSGPFWKMLHLPAIAMSEPHGYKTEPFELALSCPDAPDGTGIYYTLDGTLPSASNGTLYTAPFTVSGTTVVRAIAVGDFKVLRPKADTATYLFLDDIVRQASVPSEGWPANGAVNGQNMRYGMNQTIVNGDLERLCRGMTNTIATLSIVTDLGNLFNAQTGIYVNASNDGRTWEREISLEQIDPVNGASNEFQTDAGLRIRGAFSRSSGNPKHSFRLFFRDDNKLSFPLFGDEGVDEFKKVDLRTSQNYSWANGGSGNCTFIEELFSRDSQRDLGDPYTRTRQYHLFINGIYWGLYQTQERVGDDYAESYLGGDAEDWDCIKTSYDGGYKTTINAGNGDAFRAVADIASSQGFAGAHADNYNRLLGLNPDGTPNPEYPKYLDAKDLIHYMFIAHFTGDSDSPISQSNFPNNMYMLHNRKDPMGFQWLRHDAEHSLGVRDGFNEADVSTVTYGTDSSYGSFERFNPAFLYARLLENPEFKILVADEFYKAFYNDGPMTAENCIRRFAARMEEIDDAVVAESARWGSTSLNRDAWLRACKNVTNSYINVRLPYLVAEYRRLGWYPQVDPPAVLTNDSVVVSADTAFYYTTDGSDPRVEGGSVNGGATAVTTSSYSLPDPVSLVSAGDTWRFYDVGSVPAADGSGNAWNSAAYDDASWSSGPGLLGFAGSATANTVATQTHRYINHGTSGTQVTTTYFRRHITVPAAAAASTVVRLTGTALYDDGCVIYVNGVEACRLNMPGGDIGYATWSDSNVGSPAQNTYQSCVLRFPAGTLREGDNVVAVELHQSNASSTDLYFDMTLGTDSASYGDHELGAYNTVVSVAPGSTVLARAYADGEWSALMTFEVPGTPIVYAEPADALRVAEVMSSTVDDGGDGSEYIVLTNLDAVATVALEGVRITCAKVGKSPSLDIALPAMEIPAGESVTLTRADYWPDAKITNGEVNGVLYDAEGAVVQTFHFDAGWWGKACDGTGASFIALDFGGEVTEQAQWRPSFTCLPDVLRVAEVMSSTADAGGDGLEYIVLTNLNDSAKIDLTGLRITCTKNGDDVAKVNITLPAGTTVLSGASLVLRKADYAEAGWDKITNGKVDIVLTDVAGATVQTLYIDAKWWSSACDGTGASFIALDFGDTVTTDSQWKPSFLPPTDKTGLKAVKAAAADETYRQWFVALGADEAGQEKLLDFTGSAADLETCYLIGIAPVASPDVDLRIDSIDVDAGAATLSLTGSLRVGGEPYTDPINGGVYLLRYGALDAVPETNALEATSFPVTVEDLDATDNAAFYRLLIQ